MERKVYTIGYEGQSLESFLALLKREKVRLVADVREMPLSRKPGFSKTAIAKALEANGIAYVHIRDLGCPSAIRDRFRADSDWNRYVVAFTVYLAKQRDAVVALAEICKADRTALMCFERDFNRCHRTFVAREVARTLKGDVAHIVEAAALRTGATVRAA
ncbi:MAG TPA: DUF488 domain-containing protein [Steroidobacteraceae bacterium]|nr:DUF488 domain-containing protein [Steroidobacteraceae bacterium]